MAYDPDYRQYQDIIRSKSTFIAEDRQSAYDDIVDHLSKKFGVTQCGDVLTVRTLEFQATFILHEIKLPRDKELGFVPQ